MPGNQSTSYTYDAAGNLTGVTDPDSQLTMAYDLVNRLMSVSTTGSSNQPSVTLGYTSDPTGHRLSVRGPLGVSNYAYDALARLRTLTTPAGRATAAPGAVATWPAEGSAADPVGNQHGVLQQGTGFTSSVVGQGFQLDGVDDYVAIADSAALDSLTTAVTMEAWINPQPSGHFRQAVFARRDPLVRESLELDVLENGQ